MLKLTIEISGDSPTAGVEQTLEWLRKLGEEAEPSMWRAVEYLLQQIDQQAMQNLQATAPHSVGGIERSKELTVSPPEASLSYGETSTSPVPYAVIREFGGIVFGRPFLAFEGKYGAFAGEYFVLTEAHHLPHPFLFPAFDQEFPRLDGYFYDELERQTA